MLKLKTTVFVSVLALAACSGGGNGGSSSEKKEGQTDIVAGFTLPPEPDAALAKTQVIDTNSNGIRDEVERKVVMKFKDDGSDVVKMGLKMAQVKQEIVLNLDDKDMVLQGYKKVGLVIDCLVLKYGASSEKIDDFIDFMKASIEDTEERKKEAFAFKKVLSGGTYFLPKKQEVSEFCNSL